MYQLSNFECGFVCGGADGAPPPAPTCTTTKDSSGNEMTICTCPVGTELTVGTSGDKTVVTCTPKAS